MTETGETFVVPDDFHIAEVFDGTFRVVNDADHPLYGVLLRFAPSAAKYVREKVIHASQSAHAERDGGLILELSLRSLVEVRRWILSWGSECEVLEPPELRTDIHREAAAIVAQSQRRAPLSSSTPDDATRTPPLRKGGAGGVR